VVVAVVVAVVVEAVVVGVVLLLLLLPLLLLPLRLRELGVEVVGGTLAVAVVSHLFLRVPRPLVSFVRRLFETTIIEGHTGAGTTGLEVLQESEDGRKMGIPELDATGSAEMVAGTTRLLPHRLSRSPLVGLEETDVG